LGSLLEYHTQVQLNDKVLREQYVVLRNP